MDIAGDSPVCWGAKGDGGCADSIETDSDVTLTTPCREEEGSGGVEERRGNKQQGATQALLGVEEQPTPFPLH